MTTPTAPPRRPWKRSDVGRLLLSPLHRLERARGRKRLGLLMLYAAIAVPLAVLAWRELSLVGLPDVGPPFDVEAFEARSVADDRNGFVLYREAQKALIPLKFDYSRKTPNGQPIQPSYDWPTAQPEVKAYLDANAEALELWRQGTERPEALDVPWAEMRIDTRLDTLQTLREFARLAGLEAGRREANGDMAGAYAMYRAILRCAHHCDWHGTLIGRLVGVAIQGLIAGKLDAWAADSRTDTALLKRAIADVRDLAAARAPNSVSFKMEYAWALRLLTDEAELAKLDRYDEMNHRDWREFLPGIQAAYSWWTHEPERTRRVYNLVMANLLAHVDKPRERRPPNAAVHGLLYYDCDPTAPPAANRLPAAEMEAWLLSAPLARMILPAMTNALAAMDRETVRYDMMTVLLAEQLYRREHDGQPPATLGLLVGPYLEALPEGFAPEDPALTAVDAPTAPIPGP